MSDKDSFNFDAEKAENMLKEEIDEIYKKDARLNRETGWLAQCYNSGNRAGLRRAQEIIKCCIIDGGEEK